MNPKKSRVRRRSAAWKSKLYPAVNDVYLRRSSTVCRRVGRTIHIAEALALAGIERRRLLVRGGAA